MTISRCSASSRCSARMNSQSFRSLICCAAIFGALMLGACSKPAAAEPDKAPPAQEKPAAAAKKSPAAPFLALLKSGKLPQERVGLVVEMACTKGEPDDLAYIFAQAADDK